MADFSKISNTDLVNELKIRLQDRAVYKAHVDALNASIKDLSQKLHDSESLKSHFISNISNELINPFFKEESF